MNFAWLDKIKRRTMASESHVPAGAGGAGGAGASPSLEKVRGCLLGALLGDCLGSPYEYIYGLPDPQELQAFFDKMEARHANETGLSRRYTDDTAMTRCIAESLVANGCLDDKDLAERFVREFYSDDYRKGEYGGHVRAVFAKLREQKCADPFKPASEQFKGAGSYGNGGAMRIAPVPLFFHSDYEMMINAAARATKLTHTHPLGVTGAILQCIAIHHGLELDPAKGPLDVNSFLDHLLSKINVMVMDKIEAKPYVSKLLEIKKLLKQKNDPTREYFRDTIGTSVSALDAVPAAIYSFLRAQNPIDGIRTGNKFRRTIQYAIYLGGDTDTIASMAGAIAGAYFGEGEINESLKSHCQGVGEVSKLAEELHKLEKNFMK